jgi:predicted TIM-barrel fold metal-dependent hydrolase
MSAVRLRRAPFFRTWITPALTARLLGSSLFTLTLDHRDGFVNHSENNTHLLRLARSHPDRLAAWSTLDPREPRNSWRVKSYAEKGATGIKLYVGHGACNAFSGEPIFHVCGIDDDCMLPVYRTCAELRLPICLHVNCGIAAYWSELLRVLSRFRDLKFVIPHLIDARAGSAAFPARAISERAHRYQLWAG